jgi:hypothetical protein
MQALNTTSQILGKPLLRSFSKAGGENGLQQFLESETAYRTTRLSLELRQSLLRYFADLQLQCRNPDQGQTMGAYRRINQIR